MKNKIFVTAISLLLSGCKIGVDANVPFSGVLSDGIKETTAELFVEVASCTSYEDSREPSHSLLESQKSVPSILSGAEYKECFTKKMNSWARFTIPISYGQFVKGNVKDDGRLHILSLNSDNNSTVIVHASPELRAKVSNLSKDKFSNFNPSDLTIRVSLKNDTGEDKKVTVISSFVNDVPVIYGDDSIIKKDQILTLRLSDVSTQVVFSPKEYGQLATILDVYK